MVPRTPTSTRLLALAFLLARQNHPLASDTAACDAVTSCGDGAFCPAANGTCVACDPSHGCFASNNGTADDDASSYRCFRACDCADPAHPGARLDAGGGEVAGFPLRGGFVGRASGPLADAGLATEADVAGGGDLAGTVCLISRGDIRFSEKIANCQANGGIGAIISNNVPGDLRGARVVDGDDIAIPSVTIGMAEGEELKKNSIGMTATLLLCEQSSDAAIVTKAQAILPKIFGSLSMLSSALIVRNIVKSWRASPSNELLSTPSRVVLAMSIADLSSSFWAHFLSTWMMPREYRDRGVAFAAGNQATCSAQMFLAQLFIYSGTWCNVLLAVAYWLVVCRKKTERELRRWRYQLLFFGWPWLFGITMALVNIIYAGRGRVTFDVWYCQTYGAAWAQYFLAACVGIGFLMILFSIGSLIRDVFRTESKIKTYARGEVDASLLSGLKQTLQVAQQGIAFIVAFLVIFVPALVELLTSTGLPHWFYWYFACVFPGQGFLNALVFFRPKYVAIRKRQDATGSRMGAIRQMLDLAQPGFVASGGTFFTGFIGRFSGRSSGRFSFARASGGSSTGRSGGSSTERVRQSACNSVE